ncbi:MAG: metal-sensing transcriptional repressor [bacterium]
MTTNHSKILINLKKVNSLTLRIIKMVEDKKYCIDIMQQNLAVIGLLKSVHQMVMEGHLNSCFRRAMSSKDEKLKQEMINEILRLSKTSNK